MSGSSMTARLRFPRPQIATKLYGAIALILTVVYVLAAAATHFASRTEETVRRFQEDGLPVVLLSGNLELALEQQRRLVATAPFLADEGMRRRDERIFEDLTTQIPALMRACGLRPVAQAVAAIRRLWRSWVRWSWRSCATSGCIRRAQWRRSTPPPCRIYSARWRQSASGDPARARRRWRISPRAHARSSPGYALPQL